MSVHGDDSAELPADFDIEQVYADVDVVNKEMMQKGVWVFGGGLHPADTATVVRADGGEIVTTDGPYLESKEHIGGFWIIKADRPRRGTGVGQEGHRRLPRSGRGASLPGRHRGLMAGLMATLTSDAIARVFREEYGRVVAGLVRLLGNIDLAEESVQEAFVVATQRWPETGLPPNPGAWITVTARNRALDRLRRESTRAHREQRATMTDAHDDPFDDFDDRPSTRPRSTMTGCG